LLANRALAPPSLCSDEPTGAVPLKPPGKGPFRGTRPNGRDREDSPAAREWPSSAQNPSSRLPRPPLRFGTSPLSRFARKGASRASAVRFRSPTPAQVSACHAGRSKESRKRGAEGRLSEPVGEWSGYPFPGGPWPTPSQADFCPAQAPGGRALGDLSRAVGELHSLPRGTGRSPVGSPERSEGERRGAKGSEGERRGAKGSRPPGILRS